MNQSLTSGLLAGALLACAINASAEPVTFNVTAVTLTPGAGYGVDAPNENAGTLLDVLFTPGFSDQNFSLAAVGESLSFLVGTLDWRESNGSGGILTAETDWLDVTAALTFAGPLGSTQTLTAGGIATAGDINGNGDGVDYALSWDTLTDIAFGSTGLFDLSLSPVSFSATNAPSQALNATITLRALPSSPTTSTQPGSVPEPGSLALIAAALTLAGLVTGRRRGPDA